MDRVVTTEKSVYRFPKTEKNGRRLWRPSITTTTTFSIANWRTRQAGWQAAKAHWYGWKPHAPKAHFFRSHLLALSLHCLVTGRPGRRLPPLSKSASTFGPSPAAVEAVALTLVSVSQLHLLLLCRSVILSSFSSLTLLLCNSASTSDRVYVVV
ncbi:hypothetical protein TYRP_007030 [Tyrophagus putrescentiae]|nr:hypothetical protein TYRP_007030 [Tyrophagus putrescentiae]